MNIEHKLEPGKIITWTLNITPPLAGLMWEIHYGSYPKSWIWKVFNFLGSTFQSGYFTVAKVSVIVLNQCVGKSLVLLMTAFGKIINIWIKLACKMPIKYACSRRKGPRWRVCIDQSSVNDSRWSCSTCIQAKPMWSLKENTHLKSKILTCHF